MITPELLDRFSTEFTEDKYAKYRYREVGADSTIKYCAIGFLVHLYLKEYTYGMNYNRLCIDIGDELNDLIALHAPDSPNISFVNDNEGYTAVMELIDRVRSATYG